MKPLFKYLNNLLAISTCLSMVLITTSYATTRTLDGKPSRIYQECMDNGFSPEQITLRTSNLTHALLKMNASLFAQQFSYPMVVHVEKDHKIKTIGVRSSKQLIALFPKLYNKKSARAIVQPRTNNTKLKQQWQSPICRANGVGLFNGAIWLHNDKHKMLKGFVLNI
mgnify:CR=1 FL=1